MAGFNSSAESAEVILAMPMRNLLAGYVRNCDLRERLSLDDVLGKPAKLANAALLSVVETEEGPEQTTLFKTQIMKYFSSL